MTQGSKLFDDIKRSSASQLLDDLAQELETGGLEDTVVVKNSYWKFRLLCDHERRWVDLHIKQNSVPSIISSMKAPILAIGIRALGKPDKSGKLRMTPIGELYPAPSGEDSQYFAAEKFFEWLSNRNTETVQELWTQWEKLEHRRVEAENAMSKVLRGGWDLEGDSDDAFITYLKTEPTLSWKWQQLKIKARVCSNKHLLMSDPRLQTMTKTRWLFEAWQLRLAEEQRIEQVNKIGEQGFEIFQSILTNVIGLNIEPIAEPATNADEVDKPKYRWPQKGEYTPLIFAIARPDYLKTALEKVNELLPQVQEEAISPEITEEDLEFFDDLDIGQQAKWNSLEMQAQLKQHVIMMDPSKVSPHENRNLRPAGLTPEERAALNAEKGFGPPKKRPSFTIDANNEDMTFDEPIKTKI
jgi:hypothetical protein